MAEIRITADFEGLDGVQSAVDRIQRAIEPPSVTESIGKGADVFVDSMKAAAPKRSGRLAASVDKHREGDGWVVTANTPYNHIQNSGGVITTRYAPFLVFVLDGHVVKRRSVTIPATHYVDEAYGSGFEPAAEAAKAAIQAKIDS